MSIGISSFEHAVANVAHEISVGARAVEKVLAKVGAVSIKDAPELEALTSLIDPRAASIERIGAALIGELEPQLEKVAGNVSADSAKPTFGVSLDLVTELKALVASMSGEIATAKASVTVPATPAKS